MIEYIIKECSVPAPFPFYKDKSTNTYYTLEIVNATPSSLNKIKLNYPKSMTPEKAKTILHSLESQVLETYVKLTHPQAGGQPFPALKLFKGNKNRITPSQSQPQQQSPTATPASAPTYTQVDAYTNPDLPPPGVQPDRINALRVFIQHTKASPNIGDNAKANVNKMMILNKDFHTYIFEDPNVQKKHLEAYDKTLFNSKEESVLFSFFMDHVIDTLVHIVKDITKDLAYYPSLCVIIRLKDSTNTVITHTMMIIVSSKNENEQKIIRFYTAGEHPRIPRITGQSLMLNYGIAPTSRLAVDNNIYRKDPEARSKLMSFLARLPNDNERFYTTDIMEYDTFVGLPHVTTPWRYEQFRQVLTGDNLEIDVDLTYDSIDDYVSLSVIKRALIFANNRWILRKRLLEKRVKEALSAQKEDIINKFPPHAPQRPPQPAPVQPDAPQPQPEPQALPPPFERRYPEDRALPSSIMTAILNFHEPYRTLLRTQMLQPFFLNLLYLNPSNNLNHAFINRVIEELKIFNHYLSHTPSLITSVGSITISNVSIKTHGNNYYAFVDVKDNEGQYLLQFSALPAKYGLSFSFVAGLQNAVYQSADIENNTTKYINTNTKAIMVKHIEDFDLDNQHINTIGNNKDLQKAIMKRLPALFVIDFINNVCNQAEQQAQGGRRRHPKPRLLTTPTYTTIKGRRYRIYTGPKGGQYIKTKGAFKKLTTSQSQKVIE